MPKEVTSVTVKVPGKLYIAGEYAVVEGCPAILVAIDHYLSVSIAPRQGSGLVWSSQQPDLELVWKREEGQLVFDSPHPYQLIAAAMQVAEDYVSQKRGSVNAYYQVRVSSDLDHGQTGAKYGLGSSGAVTVGVIRAILSCAGLEASPLRLYQLAVLAQMRLKLKGSFGDLAASSFGGWIAYCRPKASWLEEKVASLPLIDLLDMDWPNLWIAPLTLPEQLSLLVGWSQSASSTDRLVNQMTSQVKQEQAAKHHQQFLIKSRSCVEDLIAAFRLGDLAAIKAGLRHNRQLLKSYGEAIGLSIETPTLSRLIRLAEATGAVAKTSGAGGGDCGFCLVDTQEQAEEIRLAWQAAGILPLPLSPSPIIEEG